MTERVCKTCCWWARENSSWGACQLEPLLQGKGENERCRHHSFTTGWLEENELPEDELPENGLLEPAINPDDEQSAMHGIDRSPNDFWKSPEHESPSDLDAKVKALSKRCKDARRLLERYRVRADVTPLEVDSWLAGDDE